MDTTKTLPRTHLRRRLVGGFLIATTVIVSFLGGTYVGLVGLQKWGYLDASVPSYILNSQNKDAKPIDFSLFWQAWNVVDQDYHGSTNDEKRVEGAISGMLSSLGDPYTVYFPPSENNLFQSSLQGNFGGIGAELSVKNGLLTVVSALDETPAQKAGLQGGDIITEIGGKKAADLNFDDAVMAIRGEKGTQVELTLLRSGVEKPFKLTITRDTIVVKSVKTESLGPDKQFAYIKINQFGQDTDDLLDAALIAAKKENKKGVIIDLRDNPGGYLDSAVTAIGRVIPTTPSSTDSKLQQRVAVVEKYKDGTEKVHKAENEPILETLPMAVLVNGGSASASEIFAGAMRDYKRATLIGSKTFGKGSVQELKNLANGGSLKVTIAKWFTPAGVGIDGKGIEPDEAITLPEGTLPSTSDPQVLKAIELLSK